MTEREKHESIEHHPNGPWGRWRLDAERNVLLIAGYPNHDYEIDLDECTSVGQVLDWIIHLREKIWVTAEDLGHLWCAFEDLFGAYPTFVTPARGIPIKQKGRP